MIEGILAFIWASLMYVLLMFADEERKGGLILGAALNMMFGLGYAYVMEAGASPLEIMSAAFLLNGGILLWIYLLGRLPEGVKNVMDSISHAVKRVLSGVNI